jgi:hypothetical protein
MRRRALAALATLLVAGLMVLAVPAAAGAAGRVGGRVPALVQQPEEDPDGDPSTDDAPLAEHDMIPRPNSGRAPTDAGDRGGALQGLVLLFIVVGVGGIAALVVRESRRARAARSNDSAQASSPWSRSQPLAAPGVTTDATPGDSPPVASR